jgi:hypothetical protein
MKDGNITDNHERRPFSQKTRKQIGIVFLMSLVFSSLLVFFAVYTRTQMANEEFKNKAKENENSQGQTEYLKP